MSSEPYEDAGAHRIKRKPPPPFPYSPRYPEPDPSDPFAPLSVLRDRTATLTNSPYESPVAIPDSTSGPPRVLDLATFITHQREKSAALGPLFGGESGWQGHMSQLRKGTSMGPGLHEYSSGTDFPVAASSTLRPGVRETQRREARRRSQSVFALRSGTFSFLESRPGPESQSNVERRHSLTPYASRASVITSSSTSSWVSTHGERKANKTSPRPRSCNSSFVSATLLDGVPEVPTRKSMHAMQVDTPTTSGVEKRSLAESPLPVLPPPLEKRNPSDSSTGSWSRDLVFYSAPSRPQTPSSIRSSRPVSLPPSATLSFPFVPDNLLPTKPAPFTTSPVTSSTHNATPIPSNLATSFPPKNPDSHGVPMPEDRDIFPPQLSVRFPRRGQSAESEPESIERESGRFARLRSRTAAALQTRRSSTSSSLRSTLRAATEAADKLAAEDASVVSFPPVAYMRVAQAPVVISVSESTDSRSLATGTPESKKPEGRQRIGPQIGGGGYGAEQPASAPSATRTSHQQDMDCVPAVRSAQLPAELERDSPPKPDVKIEQESVPSLKRRRASRSSYKGTAARRSYSTSLPLSRPLPSPPTITKHPEPMVKLSPTPLPHAKGPGLSHQQVQRYPTAPASLMDGAPQPSSHALRLTPSASSHTSLPAGAAQPRVVHAPTLSAPHTTSPTPSAQMAYSRPPRPLSRSVQRSPMSSSTVQGYASDTIRSTSSNSSHFDNMSTMSAPQLRRRDASPSSSHGWHASSHTSERLGHNLHPQQHPVPRSLSEQGFPGILSFAQLAQAARIPVVRENGVRVQFGELWRMQRTVAIFIRHFWCPMCQDYLTSLMRDVDHAALTRTGIRLIVIGCGSYGLIRSYRQIFRLPYEIFVDASPGQILYHALGMGNIPSGAHKTRCSAEHAGVSYVRHGAVSGLAMVVAHALRVGMPVWERGGDASQLGGEFVLGPGLSCTYVHRMQNTAGHAPIVDVLSAAGVRAARKVPGVGPRPNISLPLERGADGRDAKVLSVVREEACGTCGACEGCAEALNIGLEPTASGEWSVVVTGKAV